MDQGSQVLKIPDTNCSDGLGSVSITLKRVKKHFKNEVKLKQTKKIELWDYMPSRFTCCFHRWLLHICGFSQSTNSDRWLPTSSVTEWVFLWRNSGHRGHKNPSKCTHCVQCGACKSHSSTASWRMLWTSPPPNTTNNFLSLSIKKKIIFCWRQK